MSNGRMCTKCTKFIDGAHQAYCKACAAAYARENRKRNPGSAYAAQKKWQEANPHQYKAIHLASRLKREYGITVEEFEEIKARQYGQCAICQCPIEGKNLHVDHCHETGIVRGLLCSSCNMGIGLFKDDPARLDAAKYYLSFHQIIMEVS